MSFVRYQVFDDEESEEEPTSKYSSFVDLEEFEDDPPEAFSLEKPGSSLEQPQDDRDGVKGWDPHEDFFSCI